MPRPGCEVLPGTVPGVTEGGEAALDHRHLQVLDVREVPVDGWGGDADPLGHSLQGQLAGIVGDHLAGRGDELFPQPASFAPGVAPPPSRPRLASGGHGLDPPGQVVVSTLGSQRKLRP